VAELAELCARLPLALAIVTARAVTNPGFPLSTLVDELRETRRIRERRRTPDPLAQEAIELLLERLVGARRIERGLELGDRRHERLRQELPAELAVAAPRVHAVAASAAPMS
jgi:hypothetical protein